MACRDPGDFELSRGEQIVAILIVAGVVALTLGVLWLLGNAALDAVETWKPLEGWTP